jgi:superfamily I DNA and/or RNA helicase
LMEFPNKYFYNGKLKAAEEVKNITLADLIWKKAGKWINSKEVLYWFDIKWKQILHWESKSLYNLEEIELVGKIIKELFSLWVKPQRVGVISPYSAQVNKLKEKYEELGIEINTVDGFQWREKEIIIISWVRTEKIWFLADPRRLNVAITRPKRLLINIGDSQNLQSDKFFKEYLKFIREKWNLKIFQ